MFSTIVVGVDGRRGGREALRLARRLGGPGRGAVVAVHVYPRPLLRPSELDTELETRAAVRALLSEELSVAGVEARSRVVADSSPGRGLHRVADGLRADLVVVGPPISAASAGSWPATPGGRCWWAPAARLRWRPAPGGTRPRRR